MRRPFETYPRSGCEMASNQRSRAKEQSPSLGFEPRTHKLSQQALPRPYIMRLVVLPLHQPGFLLLLDEKDLVWLLASLSGAIDTHAR